MFKEKYDLIVVGSGPGGFPAAIAAARRGLKVLMIEKNAKIGGLLVTGLPLLAFLDRFGNTVVRGIAQELINKLQEVGAANRHLKSPILNSMTHVNGAWMSIILFEMCEEENNLDVLLYSELMDVQVDNGKVKGVKVLCRGEVRSFAADLIIDATGDACAVYMSGAKYEKGNAEGKNLQPPTITFEVSNVDYDQLIEYLREHPQAYDLPVTFNGIKQNIEFFTENDYFNIMGFSDLVNEGIKRGDFTIPRNMIDFCKQLNGNAFFNVTRAVGTDVTDIESLIKADFLCHRQVKELLIFIRKNLPGFENCHLVSVSPWLGVRESRRLVGQKKLTVDQVLELSVPEDSIAIAGYNIDIHSPDNEAMYYQPIEHGVGIPYGCLVPEHIEGLLASGRAISVDQDVFAMTRVMPTCMAVGEAAGTAMAIAHIKGILPSQIDVNELRDELRHAGAIVDLEK